MHEFMCGHEECASQFTASSKEVLMSQVAEHLKKVHAVQTPTQTLMGYLETTCVTTTPDR
jgi:hypothetical protein